MVVYRNSCHNFSVSLLLFLILAVVAHALDQRPVTAIPLKPLNEFSRTHDMPGPEVKTVRLNSADSTVTNLQGPIYLVQAMREQIQLAKKVASLARLNKHPRLLRELRSQIKENERALGASVTDSQLPKSAPEKMRALRQVLLRATEQHDKCDNTVKRLRSSVMANEDKVLALKKENRNLGRLAARTMPKGFHCLALQLTIQYYNHLGEGLVFANQSTVEDAGLMHYAIYTQNILAATAIINSTVYSAKDSHQHVFHVLTDGLNHAALQMWFQSNKLDKTIVEVKNLENLNVLRSFSSSDERSRKYLKPGMSKAYPKQEEGIEMMKRLGVYYDLPRIFPRLEKVLVLDEDIVVQTDLSHLWKEDLDNKVIGAVGSCQTSSDQDGTLDWACMNLVDLGEWRRQSLNELSGLETDIRDGLTILRQSNTRILDNSVCHVIDLDDTSAEFANITQDAAAVHYRGYAKPWLGMGMNRHRSLWTRFVDYNNPLLQACNVHK